ncbi:Ribosomal protein S5 domain 2-type fold [Acididesulfobacillus acetoxydans]|uniref:GHMP kinase N terminal domain protein n=1 Tax=Acididesulfobacillus acetoxydans TaxID=1561005 RepID=A0A8S0VXH6_9FIRM|nr:GHMP kinase [Acididesulfobacillus acetoxydans]CAA7601913.1 Ribosomal protein S5 domain 2-type fold [Acididesulfobacillus acetoxydans]CEJ08243.1 GHMP kinase N terminal domain protein [Acididesulfobacillus acetoxydans]
MALTAWARCPGTCGEWVQGAQSGVPFLVDCPIDRYAEAVVEMGKDDGIWLVPREKEKVRKALLLMREERSFSGGGILRFRRELPTGKGMASSTADIVSACAAVAAASGETVSGRSLARWAFGIEPSDSVMFPGLTEINHIRGSYHRTLGAAVPAGFLALDWGGEVDTLRFNARADLYGHYRKYEFTIGKALALVREGIRGRDLEKMAAGSTLSAACNLEVNPKPWFGQFKAWVRSQGGLGLVTAHSGTLIAGVFPPDYALDGLLAEAKERFRPVFAETFRARDGGVEYAFAHCGQAVSSSEG